MLNTECFEFQKSSLTTFIDIYTKEEHKIMNETDHERKHHSGQMLAAIQEE